LRAFGATLPNLASRDGFSDPLALSHDQQFLVVRDEAIAYVQDVEVLSPFASHVSVDVQ
jgi:hypothetical protein